MIMIMNIMIIMIMIIVMIMILVMITTGKLTGTPARVKGDTRLSSGCRNFETAVGSLSKDRPARTRP